METTNKMVEALRQERAIDIRPNNCATNDPCAFCGSRTDPQIPAAIFKRGTYEPVCDVCAQEIDGGVYRLYCAMEVDYELFYAEDFKSELIERRKKQLDLETALIQAGGMQHEN